MERAKTFGIVLETAGLLIVALTLSILAASGAWAASYYVSPSGNDAWSGLLPSPAGSDGPFQTIQHAILAARTSSANKTIYVRAGAYFLNGGSVSLNSNDSGLQLLAYPGETPIVSGGVPVSNWQAEPSISGAWSAALPAWLYSVGVVTVNGDWYDIARTPNVNPTDPFQDRNEWFIVQKTLGPVVADWQVSSWTDDSFVFRGNDLNPQIYNGEPTAGIVIWDKFGWSCEVWGISSIDYVNKAIKMTGASQFGLSGDSRYYIFGTKGSLDAPGEYYFDKTAGRLWIIPKNGLDPNNAVVSVAPFNGPAVIDINGGNNIRISGLAIRDQHNRSWWGVPVGGGVHIESGNGNIIENNTMTSIATGVALDAGSDNIIRRNEINHTVNTGVVLEGTRNSLLANHISYVGLVQQAEKGVVSASGPNRVAYNFIERTPSYGIMSDDSNPADGLLIEYNKIFKTSQSSRDAGAIYLKNKGKYNAANPEIVRYNWIYDTGGVGLNADLSFNTPDTSWGVYLDEGQSGTNVYGNLINVSSLGGVFPHLGTNNSVTNNIFANGVASNFFNDSPNNPKGNVFQQNISYGNVPPIIAKTAGQEAAYSQNVYWNTVSRANASAVFANDGGSPMTFAQWQAAGLDAGSQLADPLFVNPAPSASADFHLQGGSPASSIGFIPLPFEQMGPAGYVDGSGVSAPTITSAGAASGVVGSSFTYQIVATNNPASYNATGLPAGLSVNTASGLISGTPSAAGTFSATISAANSAGAGSANLALTISGVSAPTITSAAAASGVVGSSFTYQIVATNNPASYNATGLPAGLSIDTASGLISGTPSAAGSSNPTLSASNSAGTGSATLALTISGGAPPSNGLVAHWALDDGSGNSARDSAGVNNAVLVGSPTWTMGIIGGALSFDGIGQYGSAKAAGLPAIDAPQSLAFWYKVAANPSGRGALDLVALMGNAAAASDEAMFDGAGHIGMGQWGGGMTLQAPVPAAGIWRHFAWTWDGTTNRLYLDGALAATSTAPLQAGAVDTVDFGTYDGPSALLGFGNLLVGSLDDVRLYNRALPGPEIATLFNVGIGTAPRVLTSIALSPAEVTVVAGDQQALTARALDQNGYPLSGVPVAYSSDNSAVATVDQTGLVTGIKPGSASIVANSGAITSNASLASVVSATAPPTVMITAPAASATTQGMTDIVGTASGAHLASVMVSVDGGPASAASGAASWSFPLDTTALSDGTHTVAATAIDASSRTATASLSVNVKNSGVARMALVGVNLSGGEFAEDTVGTMGASYTYPDTSEIDYYAGKGVKVLRIPFLAKRLIRSGTISQADASALGALIDYAGAKGISVILDMHDYGYTASGQLIGRIAGSVSEYASQWSLAAAYFKGKPNVIWGLMNEPYDQTAAEWLSGANAAIQAIRNTGATQLILVPGSYWDGAWTWTESDNSAVVGGGVVDPLNHYAFEMHQYLDSDGSGTHPPVVSKTIGVERLTAATLWAKSHGAKIFLGELGVAVDTQSLAALDATLAYMQQNSDVWLGVSYWAGGPWWGPYMYSIEPASSGDKPQMGILAKYVGGNAGGSPTPPTVAIVSPIGGASVSGTIAVRGTTFDSLGISGVAVSVDSGDFSLAVGTGSWIYFLNTSLLANGPHQLSVKATSLSGVSVVSSVSVTVGNSGLLAPSRQVDYYSVNDGSRFSRSLAPLSVASAGGTVSQAVNSDGSIAVTIAGVSGYADSGFYLRVGKLGDLSKIRIRSSTGAFSLNLWLDRDNNGEFFIWNGNTESSLGQDAYLLGPSAQSGSLTVDDTTIFTSLNPGGGNFTLAQLKAGAAPNVSTATNAAIWVGVAATAANVSATIDCLSVNGSSTDCGAPGAPPSSGWSNASFASQSGAFTAGFDAVPSMANEDVVIGFSSGPTAAYAGLAAAVRFNNAGTIDARSGGAYAAISTLTYSAGTSYHFRMVVNVPTHAYDVYVTPQGQAEVMLAQAYAFRTEQLAVASLANVAKYGAMGDAAVSNFAIALPGAAPVIISAGFASGTAGSPFSFQIGATNNPTRYGAAGLPTGLSVNAASGLISGIPSSTGTFNVILSAVNAYGNGAATLSMTINAANVTPPSVMLTSPADGATVSGTIGIDASVSTSVISVMFLVDGSSQGVAASAPYSFSWDTTQVPDGSHVLTAVASDAAGNSATAAPVTVNVANPVGTLCLVGAPSALGVGALAYDPATLMSQVLVALRITSRRVPPQPSLQLSLPMPSGLKTVMLHPLAADPSLYSAQVSGTLLAARDFAAVGTSHFSITIGTQTFSIQGQSGRIEPLLGGVVTEASGGGAFVIISAGNITQSAQITINPLPADPGGRRASAMARQNLQSLGAGRDIVMVSSGLLKQATLTLPIDPSLLPKGVSLSQARIAYFNGATGAWEVQQDARLVGNALQTDVVHFSPYQPVILVPSSVAGLRDTYVYPNPAVTPNEPTIRASLGLVDSVEMTIFDVAGRQVHSGSLTGAPTGISEGEYYYDYTWTGHKASGVYFAVIHGKKSDGTVVRARARFIVVR